MNKDIFRSISILILIIILAGCGTPPATPTPSISVTATNEPEAVPPTVSLTPDPCSSPQLEVEVQKVHAHMREFDDASVLASNMPREQLSDSISELQRIRREAADEPIPACLHDLKAHQVEHMNSVINTLIAFMGGADQQNLDQGIAAARDQHDEYTLELAKVLGLTVVPANPATAPSATPTP